jgi:D-3-phosphoglycerate dehydrogenase
MEALLMPAQLREHLLLFLGDPSSEELVSRLSAAPIAIVSRAQISAATLQSCAPGLRSIVFLGSSAASYIDLSAAARLGVGVRTVRGYGDRAVAEHTIALMLAAIRDIARMDREIRAGQWQLREGCELSGLKLGVIGTGGIGAEVIRIAVALGMTVMAWNRSPPRVALPCRYAPLETVLATADILSLHLALADETRHFIDHSKITRMKPGVILVNTARGALNHEAALIEALPRVTCGTPLLTYSTRSLFFQAMH